MMNDTRANTDEGTEPDWARLREGVEKANIPALLMCLHQITGEESWLSPPFAPRRARGIENNDSGGLDELTQGRIRDAAFDAITRWLKGTPLKLARPSNEQLAHMLAVCVGETVPADYGEAIASNMRLDPMEPGVAVKATKTAIIIGGGISGICAAVEMQKLGIGFTLFEKNSEFGGTWWENRYPGCGVDTPNLTYTFSFQATDWSRYFPLRDEIKDYICQTADKYGLYDRTRFCTKVEKAEWLEKEKVWEVTVVAPSGEFEKHRADILFSAVGILNTPKVPEVHGLSSFNGPVIHSSNWSDDIQLEGQRIAIVGNGASAMQIGPEIADRVEHLTIFAKSKQWAAPFPHFREEVPDGVRYLIQVVPLYRAWLEQRLAWMFNDRLYNTLFRDPTWAAQDQSINEANDRHREFLADHIRAELGDRQDLLPEVLPDYPPYLKRMLLDNGWFRMLTKPNVRLISDRLKSVTGNTLRSASGQEAEADVMIMATGYNATEMLNSYDIIGRGGRLLKDYWETDNAAAYLGITVPGFPNFFIFVGPNAGSGHGGSMMRIMENQVHYALRVLNLMFSHGADQIEVKEAVYNAYRDRVDETHDRLMWSHPGTDNWYRNSKGRVVGITPWRHDAYWRMTREADPSDYCFGSDAGNKSREVEPPEL